MSKAKTILFIEDDHAISKMYARTLTKNGYVVDFAYDGAEGVKMAASKHYDLILLDIMMPELTGFEVLDRLRGDDGRGLPGTRIVILTNYVQSESSSFVSHAQADGFLLKANIVPSQLVKMLQQYSRK